MNRPQNRQPRPPRGENIRGGRGHGNGRGRNQTSGPVYPSSVPSVQQVVTGAHVSIVLKEDQPTGREVQGIVKDILTRGNHPRGIKVRLQDGRVGRVQRMVGDEAMAINDSLPHHGSGRQETHGSTQFSEGPPPRSLADYLPKHADGGSREQAEVHDLPSLSTANAVCPVCGLFEGDEAAVSHHVESHFA